MILETARKSNFQLDTLITGDPGSPFSPLPEEGKDGSPIPTMRADTDTAGQGLSGARSGSFVDRSASHISKDQDLEALQGGHSPPAPDMTKVTLRGLQSKSLAQRQEVPYIDPITLEFRRDIPFDQLQRTIEQKFPGNNPLNSKQMSIAELI
jgi:hypothetical protein